MSSWLLLANAYVDLGTWNCFTPFVGAGIGGAYNTLHDFSDVGIPTAGRGFGRNPSQWNLAWALYAGVAYEVTRNFKVELAYRYLNYGVDHRHRRLRRRLPSRLLQVRQSHLERHHARPALDLLRCCAATGRLRAAALAQPRLTRALPKPPVSPAACRFMTLKIVVKIRG